MLVDENLQGVRWPHVDRNGTQHTRSIDGVWTESALNRIGLWTLNIDERPIGLVRVSPGPREWRGDPQEAWQTWISEKIPATDEAVNDYREVIVARGGSVDVGGGKTLSLDLRDERDFRNLHVLYSRAETAKREGETRQLRLRDSDNLEHLVSVDEMLALGKAIYESIDNVYRASWLVKERITDGSLVHAEDIPATFDAILGGAA